MKEPTRRWPACISTWRPAVSGCWSRAGSPRPSRSSKRTWWIWYSWASRRISPSWSAVTATCWGRPGSCLASMWRWSGWTGATSAFWPISPPRITCCPSSRCSPVTTRASTASCWRPRSIATASASQATWRWTRRCCTRARSPTWSSSRSISTVVSCTASARMAS